MKIKSAGCNDAPAVAEGVEGGEKPPLSRSAERETPQNPKGAPHRVNGKVGFAEFPKTVRWTVIQEGHALQGRAAPSESPAGSPLQGRTPLNELSKSPKPVSLKYVLPITYINTYIYPSIPTP